MSKINKSKNASSPKALHRQSRTAKSPLAQRNPVALNPLLGKSHVHSKSNMASRSKNKQELKRPAKEDLVDG
jgi:hypothetical protein